MLDWEENLFVGLKRLWHGAVVAPGKRRRLAVQATLEGRRHGLFLLAHLIAGRSVGLLETRDAGLCGEGRIYLPPEIDIAESPEANARLYELKTIVGALAIRERWSCDAGSLQERVTEYLGQLPGLRSRIEEALDALDRDVNLWDWMGVPGALESDRVSGDKEVQLHLTADLEEAGSIIEIQGEGRADVQIIESQEDFGTGSEMPEHVFEKVETLEEYDGQSRKSDAEESLQEHEEALRDLDMRQVMRSAERPRSIYRADLILDGSGTDAADAELRGIPYPEWDHRRHAYRQDWCFVQANSSVGADPSWAAIVASKHEGLIRRLRKQFASQVNEWMRVHRQPVGSEFDLDAVIHAEVDRRCGRTPTEAVYQDRHRDLQDVAALILMDRSYSTDSWIDDSRVFDTIRETILCASEVLVEFIDSFAIAAFSSNTRRACSFDLIKDFDEDWHASRARLGGIVPDGYTRIGPALRHAQERLAGRSAGRKIVILVTDGRPGDYDRYEGAYGIADVKKAILTGKREGIETHAFAIEKRAVEFFPRMFTRDRYDILPRPEALARSLCRLFIRLAES